MDKIPFNAARYPDEDFETYQLRRWNENQYFKNRARRCTVVWNSSVDGKFTKEALDNSFTLRIDNE